jgi:hypothetical protein
MTALLRTHRWSAILILGNLVALGLLWSHRVQPLPQHVLSQLQVRDSLREVLGRLPQARRDHQQLLDLAAQRPAVSGEDNPLQHLEQTLRAADVAHAPLRATQEDGRLVVVVEGSGSAAGIHEVWRRVDREGRWILLDWTLRPDGDLVAGRFRLARGRP